MRFSFDPRKSLRPRANPRRGIGFEEAQELFSRAYWLDQRSEVPDQYRAIGWVGERLYPVIFRSSRRRRGGDSSSRHFVEIDEMWKSTKEEIRLYEKNA